MKALERGRKKIGVKEITNEWKFREMKISVKETKNEWKLGGKKEKNEYKWKKKMNGRLEERNK